MRSRFSHLMSWFALITAPGGPASAATPPAEAMHCERRLFGRIPDGAEISLYTLTGPRGIRVKVMDLGATLTEVRAPDARGTAPNVVLGFDHLEPYLLRPSFLGATVGRFANRIAGGKFTLDGTTLTLNANNGVNHLHGGPRGFDKLVWYSRALPATADGVAVEFTLLSPDGDENYPGNLRVTVTYTLTASGVLRLNYL